MNIKGLIFDFDGLILDTEMPCFMAWVELYKKYGSTFTMQDYGRIIGTDNSKFNPALNLVHLTNGLINQEEINTIIFSRTRELIEKQSLLPGVYQTLESAKNLDIPMAIASSSKRNWVEGYLSSLNIRPFFLVLCTFEDVKQVKPNPELYLLAANRLGFLPSEVLVFEDSLNGIKAAHAAGAYCIAIPNEITREMDLSMADRVVTSFQEVDLNEFLKG